MILTRGMTKAVKLLNQQSKEQPESEVGGQRFVAKLRVFRRVGGYSGVSCHGDSSWGGYCHCSKFYEFCEVALLVTFCVCVCVYVCICMCVCRCLCVGHTPIG